MNPLMYIISWDVVFNKDEMTNYVKIYDNNRSQEINTYLEVELPRQTNSYHNTEFGENTSDVGKITETQRCMAMKI